MITEPNLRTDLTDLFLNKYKHAKRKEKNKNKQSNDNNDNNNNNKIVTTNIKDKIKPLSKIPIKIQTKTNKIRSKKHKYKRGPMGPMGPQGMSNLTEIFASGETYNLPQSTYPQVLEIIKTSPSTWSSFANMGLNGIVNCIVELGDVFYVGGTFSQTADGSVTNLNNIAKYDPSGNNGNGLWSPLAKSGLNGEVKSICFVDNVLYVGGQFSQTVDDPVTSPTILNNIAKYNPSGNSQWSTLANNGLNGTVNCIINVTKNFENFLYVGGNFSETADGEVLNLNYIANYDSNGNGLWTSIGSNLGDYVNCICYDGNNLLYVGGEFDNRIVLYNIDTTTWSLLASSGLNGQVLTIVINNNGVLYVGGFFSDVYGQDRHFLNHIASYDPLESGQWSPLANNGLNNLVRTIAIDITGLLWVGGDFDSTYDSLIEDLNLITTYNTNTNNWLSLTNKGLLNESGGGSISGIRAILPTSNIVYIGGENIHKTGDLLFGNFSNIVSYNTSKILNITSNGDIITTFGLYGQSVKVFYYNDNWSIMI